MIDEHSRIFCEHMDFAYRVALAATGRPEEAEDVVQDSFLRFTAGRLPNGGIGSVRAYIASVVTNTAANRGRGERRRFRREEAWAREDAMRTGQTSTASGEELDALKTALGALPPDERLAVSLHHIEGFSISETSAALAVPTSTVSDRVRRGLEALKRTLTTSGFGALAAPAVLAGLSGAEAPAGLKAAVAKLAAGKAAALSTTATTTTQRRLFMKIGLGVVALGLAAGMTFMAVGGHSAEPGKPAAGAPVEAKDPPPDQKYRLTVITLAGWAGTAEATTDGPAGMAQDKEVTKGACLDGSGNVFWTDISRSQIRGYSKERDWVSTLAGSARGYLDGPLERARFSGWSYNNPHLMCISADGKQVFLKDGARWRHIDFGTGMVSTVGMAQEASGSQLVVVRDRAGDIFAFHTNGQDVPDCKDYKKLKVAPFKAKNSWIGYMDGIALDASRIKFYWHGRYGVQMADLKTGEITDITAGPTRDAVGGPIKGTRMYCPTGMAISATGRYLYVGGGDHMFCHRFDLEAGNGTMFGRDKKGADLMFRSDEDKDFASFLYTSYAWPSACIFQADGSYGIWPTCLGLFRITPVNK